MKHHNCWVLFVVFCAVFVLSSPSSGQRKNLKDWKKLDILKDENPFHDTLVSVEDGVKSEILIQRNIDEGWPRMMGNEVQKGIWDFIPEFKGSLKPLEEKVFPTHIHFNSPCFQENEVSFVKFDDTGCTVKITSGNASSLLCYDVYLFATAEHFYIKSIFFHGDHYIQIPKWKSDVERREVQRYGFQVFLIRDGLIGSLVDIYKTYQLFRTGDKAYNSTVEENIKVIEQVMQVNFKERSLEQQKSLIMINESDIHSGDYFAITRFDGFDTMIMIGTGGMTGHTAVALRIDGELYIVESRAKEYFWPEPNDFIIKTPYKKWVQTAHSIPHYNTVFLPLSEQSRKKFNEKKAQEFFKSVEGTRYGYHNFIFGWIDTERDNYPVMISPEFLTVLFTIVDRIDPKVSDLYWLEALNHRAGTKNQRFDEIMKVLLQRNMTLAKLMTEVERDEWEYSTGRSLVCSSFVMALYKAAGLLDPFTSQIQATEFTPKDSYQIKLFDPQSRAIMEKYPECKSKLSNDGYVPYCQIMGKYQLDLKGFNSIDIYAQMNENCPSAPPNYTRPSFC